MDAAQERSRFSKEFCTIFGAQSLESSHRTELAVREFKIAAALNSGLPWNDAKLAADASLAAENDKILAASARCSRLVTRLLSIRSFE